MESISSSLVSDFSLDSKNVGWYYSKLNSQPTIPPYYVTAISNKSYVIQIYAVIDITLMQDQPAFTKQPSLVIVKHSRADRGLYLEEYGLRIIKNKGITQIRKNEKVISGEILAGEGKGTQYYAFQVTLDHFAAGNDISTAIQTEIVNVLRELPDWG